MGCFDTVLVPCPKCGKRREFQSKGGACSQAVYNIECCPLDVLSDVNRHAPLPCQDCGTRIAVGVGFRPVDVDAWRPESRKRHTDKARCDICLSEPVESESRCPSCLKAMRNCDRSTYDLILGLAKRLLALEERLAILEKKDG